MTLEELVTRWGYPAIVLGTFFEGETVVLLGGAMAHRGLLTLPGVVLAAFAGSVAGDQLWFLAGKRWGLAAVERRPRWRVRVARMQRWLADYGTTFVVGFRFIYGIRTVSPLLLGASGYSQRRFAWLNAVGAAVWAASFAALGWGVGEGLRRTFGRDARWEEMGIIVLGLAAVVAIVHRVATKPTARS